MRKESVLSITKSMLNSPYRFNMKFVRQREWLVVAVESASHFDKADCDHIAAAYRASGKPRCRVFDVEVLDEVGSDVDLEIQTTSAQLAEVSQKYGSLNLLLAPTDLSSAVLCTAADYFLVAGSAAFVATAIGKSIGEGHREFADYLASWSLRDKHWQFMKDVAEECSTNDYG